MAEIRTWYPQVSGAISTEIKSFVEDEKFYVRNRTEPLGNILLSFVEPMTGRSYLAKIPRTRLPIHLSSFAPPQAILSSVNLRDVLRKGVVEIVHPSEAEKILAEPSSREELEILYEKDKLASSTVSENLGDIPRHVDQGTYEDGVTPESFVNPRVLSIVAQLLEGTIGSKDASQQIKVMESSLSKDDFAYILNQAPDGMVKNYAKRYLADHVGPEPAAPRKKAAPKIAESELIDISG